MTVNEHQDDSCSAAAMSSITSPIPSLNRCWNVGEEVTRSGNVFPQSTVAPSLFLTVNRTARAGFCHPQNRQFGITQDDFSIEFRMIFGLFKDPVSVYGSIFIKCHSDTYRNNTCYWKTLLTETILYACLP